MYESCKEGKHISEKCNYEIIECEECGGSGFSGPGSGYDSVCDQCGGKGEHPKNY